MFICLLTGNGKYMVMLFIQLRSRVNKYQRTGRMELIVGDHTGSVCVGNLLEISTMLS